ncbi:MAG TPA: ABC transporter ATP-binding protein [Candidatus Angelobacter sp.]|jgi:ABC-2 type transport system ATP-binding protein|nr:ABC transporter ATP-binding protein [Candidatus Angelobacter sp.]
MVLDAARDTAAATEGVASELRPVAIRARGLTKRYGSRVAVDAIDFDVPAGVIAGFVGPNGSGKTTTIRMLLSFVAPTSGSAEVLGSPIDRPGDYLPRVGALIEGPAFYWWLSGRRNLEILAALDGTPESRVDEVLDIVELGDRAGDRVLGYSLGMKQRLGIAAALLPRPALLILDEPANGLDPSGIQEMRRLLTRLRDQGVTVFVSSHILSELEQMADWILVLKEGRLLFHGTMADLLARRRTTLVLVPEKPDQLDDLARLLSAKGHHATRVDHQVHVERFEGRAAEVNRLAMQAGIALDEISHTGSTLEETFLALTEGGVG